ncbi:MAG: class I tRNA ligase family protein, partial [Promethearchaeota archaeon]
DLVIILTPVIPHLCEEIYEKLGLRQNKGEFCSNTPMPDIKPTMKDKLYAKQAKFLNQLIGDIDQIVNLLKHEPKSIYIYINEPWKNTLYSLAQDLFEQQAMNIGKIMQAAKQSSTLKMFMKQVAQEAKNMMKNPTIFRIVMISPAEQKKAIKGFTEILKKRYNTEVKVSISNEKDVYDPLNKRFKARPMKPALFLE